MRNILVFYKKCDYIIIDGIVIIHNNNACLIKKWTRKLKKSALLYYKKTIIFLTSFIYNIVQRLYILIVRRRSFTCDHILYRMYSVSRYKV